MKKLSHKEICRMGEMMDGIKLNCNIYTFENAENYISRLEPFDEKAAFAVTKSMRLYRKLKKSFPMLRAVRSILNITPPGFMDALAGFQKLPY